MTGALVANVTRHTEQGLDHAWIFYLDPSGTEDIQFSLVTGQSCESDKRHGSQPGLQVRPGHTVGAGQNQTPTKQESPVKEMTLEPTGLDSVDTESKPAPGSPPCTSSQQVRNGAEG